MGKWVFCTQPNYFLRNLTHLTPLLGMEVKMLSQLWASHNYPTMKPRKSQAQWNQNLNANPMQKPPTKTEAYKITSNWKGKPNGRGLLEEKAKPKPITRIRWLLVYNPLNMYDFGIGEKIILVFYERIKFVLSKGVIGLSKQVGRPKQVSLGDQSAINMHLMHAPLPMDTRIYMTISKIINHLIKPSKVLQEPLRPPLKASNG